MQFKKSGLFTLVIIITFFSCQTDEKARLHRELDSVNNELSSRKQALLDAQQVDALLDSIDASRDIVQKPVSEVSISSSNITRLNDVNDYIRDIELKMDEMEKSIKYVNALSASILKLQTDVQLRARAIAKLEAESKSLIGNNKTLTASVRERDSIMATFVKSCESDIVVLKKMMEDVHKQNNLATANLYFKQAQALESVVSSIKSAEKRKAMQKEVVELYKISLSLGKEEARAKVNAPQKTI